MFSLRLRFGVIGREVVQSMGLGVRLGGDRGGLLHALEGVMGGFMFRLR